MIILEARAGLGNRMYSIASTYYLARVSGQKLTVLWDIDDSLGARADALFRLPEDIQIIYTTGLSLKRAPLRHIKSMRFKQKYKLAASTVMTSVSILTLMRYADGLSYLIDLAGRPEDLYIESYYCFLPQEDDQSPYFRIFTPSDTVMQKAMPVFDNLRPDTVGLHIRRTDHADAIARGPLKAFINRIDRCLQNAPSSTFYLATDDPDTQRQLLAAYPAQMIVNPSTQFTRKSSDGIIDAYIDILCLSKCAKIIGSYGSSFSQIASKLRHIPLEIVDTPQ